ncbi:PAS domain-containing protein [Yersinia pekkanenii]|uniref:LuxR family transcription regulatory protein n=1 Tax=Yersinia pekkanenii TaxID=1288385 RepID=A0A0T9QX81_9GAMM|nr:PAS domain-containing protein [Yersinia pekkanenii]CNI31205.1 LuxR family transcription regulatory protein [Yersinia pekkanenii]CRY68937.1 LuxR family transcription regulatory protein [Yersinia pekkanenii]
MMTTLYTPDKLAPIKISKQAMHFFTQSEEPWGIKDAQSRYVYANQAYFNFLDIQDDIINNIINLSYDAIPALSSLAGRLIAHDQKVMQTGLRLEAVGTLLIGDSYRSFIFEKFPLFEENGTIVGTIAHLKPFERLSMEYFLDKPFYGEATFIPPTNIFTKREWDVLFLLFRGSHRAQISDFLGISKFSIRNIISRLFLLTGVSSKEMLLELGLKKGWHLYVPPRFISIGYDILFKANLLN